MFAQLGTKQFSTIKTFGEFSERAAMNFAEHKLLDGKAKLQPLGTSLNELSISIFFHVSFCNVEEEISALKTARDSAEILPLLWGNGKLEGDFVITDIGITREETSPEGAILGASVQLSLKEYVVKDRLQQEQASNRNKGKAVGDKKPVAQKLTNPSTCPQKISGIVSSIRNHAAAVEKIFSADGGPKTAAQKSSVKAHLNAVLKLCRLLFDEDEKGKCLEKHTNISSRAGELSISTGDLSRSINTEPNVLLLFGQQYGFQQNVKALEIAARPLINQNITRK